MATWCTVQEAADITNESFTTGELQAANSILEIWVGVTTDARDAIAAKSGRDLRLLKKAEAFQAAWMKSKPALLARSDTEQVIQDSLQYTKGDQDMHILAPLAKAAVMRLSWRNQRTIDPLSPDQALLLRGKFTAETRAKYGSLGGFLEGTWEDWEDWEPM